MQNWKQMSCFIRWAELKAVLTVLAHNPLNEMCYIFTDSWFCQWLRCLVCHLEDDGLKTPLFEACTVETSHGCHSCSSIGAHFLMRPTRIKLLIKAALFRSSLCRLDPSLHWPWPCIHHHTKKNAPSTQQKMIMQKLALWLVTPATSLSICLMAEEAILHWY